MLKNKARLILRINLILILVAFQLVAIFAQSHEGQADYLSALMKGNERFVSGKLQAKDYVSERSKLVQGQQPYAIILTCSDSRLSPEIIFDESLGKLFVIRTAGHVVDPVALGSIEYAVEHLHAGLLFVMGHESCGAVKATIGGGDASANIKSLLIRIKPAVDKARSEGVAEKDLLNAAIAENVRYQMQKSVYESETLAEHITKKKLIIAGGVYNLGSGKVDVLISHLAVEQTSGEADRKDHAAMETSAKPGEMSKKADAREAKKDGKPSTEHREAQKDIKKATTAPEEKKETPSPSSRQSRFEKSIRVAYERKLDVMLKKTVLMRDDRDRCATDDCKKISAGELIKLETPFVLSVMGRPQIKVRYKGRPYYISADADAIELIEN